MAGDRLDDGELDWQGLEGDRQYSFYRKGDTSRFPWVSARDFPELVTFKAVYVQPAAARRSLVEVRTPSGAVFELKDPALLDIVATGVGADVGLLQVGRGTYDSMPMSIATTAGHASLDKVHGHGLDPRRFRSNILIESDFLPTAWLSKRLRFGEGVDGSEVLVTNGIPRCVMITIDPDTGERDSKIMRTVAQEFSNIFGVYATPSRTGRIRAGDPVFVSG